MPLDKDTADFLQKIQSIIPYSISILKENSTRWKIIFAASAGNVPLLEISSGTGVVETLQEGVIASGVAVGCGGNGYSSISSGSPRLAAS